MIAEFNGEFRFLSNFYQCQFNWNSFQWGSAECAYQASKSLDIKDWQAISLMTAKQSKIVGKKLHLRPDWEQVKYQFMYLIVQQKFFQNQSLALLLKSTGEQMLEEGNTWRDTIWGVCPPNSGNGQNWLGRILMQVRKELNGSL